MRKVILTIASIIALISANAQISNLSVTQRKALDSILKYNSRFYIPDTSEFDTSNLSFVREEYHSDPYFISADFNKDGFKDFAVLLGVKDSTANRCLTIFNGQSNGYFQLAILLYEKTNSPFYYQENVNNSLCIVQVEKSLFIMAIETCLCAEIKLEKGKYRIVPCPETEEDNIVESKPKSGISHSFYNRSIIVKPKPYAEFKEGGEVIISITINKEGQIIEKRIKSAANVELGRIALKMLEEVRFNKSATARLKESGDITFAFKTRESK